MGRSTYSHEAYASSRKAYAPEGTRATARGEQRVRETGRLDPLVDPKEFGVVRPSRVRLEERAAGGFEVTVGAPIPIEYRLDTTGSMGDNVQRALDALPKICSLASSVLPGRDPFYCASIFGDVGDKFVLCRGQFEAEAEKMVNQLSLMVPEGGGGDTEEDPHYGFFGATYLTAAYLQRVGLRSYDFTITDAPVHDRLAVKELKRVFGDEVLEKARENGHQITSRDLPTNKELVTDMLKRTHGFMLLVAQPTYASELQVHWAQLFKSERVVVLPRIEHVPHVMASLIGLTEGTLDLQSVSSFLKESNLKKDEARKIVEAVSHIPLGSQRTSPNYDRLPKKGDVFATKTDLWPVEAGAVPPTGVGGGDPDSSGEGWL